jgi:hypothetical protein
VTVASFQRALCDLIASPALCLAVRADPEVTLAGYELSAQERRRLTEVVWQRGMSTNCTLYRSNRVTPIYTMLNHTCRALGGEFASLIDQFWNAQEYRDRQFHGEVERFGAFLRRQIAAGAVSSPFAGELLDFELATNALAFGPRKEVLRGLAALAPPDADTPCRLHPLARLVCFRHDPEALFAALTPGAALPASLPVRESLVALSVVHGDLQILQLPEAMAVRIDDAAPSIIEPLTPRRAPALAKAGLLVRRESRAA